MRHAFVDKYGDPVCPYKVFQKSLEAHLKSFACQFGCTAKTSEGELIFPDFDPTLTFELESMADAVAEINNYGADFMKIGTLPEAKKGYCTTIEATLIRAGIK